MNKKLYAYLNIEHPMVAWEVAIGRIRSICDQRENRFGISLWMYNRLELYLKNRESVIVKNEFRLEYIRQKKFLDSVSRLEGVYFFKTRNDAETALERWRMPHKKKYISEVYFSGNNYTELDSEWITNCINMEQNYNNWMESYWGGEVYGEKPLTEVLASGIGVIQNNNLRLQAYKNVIDRSSTSSILLNACMAVFSENKIEDIGLLNPAIIKGKSSLKADFYINMKYFNENQDEVIKCLDKAIEKGMSLPFIIKDDEKTLFSLPNLKEYSYTFDDKEYIELFNNIHS